MAHTQFERVFDDTPVLVAYLFGSHAVGRAGPASDYDIAVLCAPELSSAERGLWRLKLIGRLIDVYHSDAIDSGDPQRCAALVTLRGYSGAPRPL